MRSGGLSRLITIERKNINQNTDYGTEEVTWVPHAVVNANVMDLIPSRSEAIRQGLELGRNQTRIRMRYRPDITTEMRIIVHGNSDVAYQIVSAPAMLGRQEGLEMVCERFTSEADE